MAALSDRWAAGCRSVESEGTIGVSWIGPAEPRDRARLDAACRALGPVAVQSAPVEVHAEEIVLVSWNTYLGRGDLPGLTRQLRDGAFTGRLPVRALVLLLQEVYREPILEFARATGLHAVFAPERRRPTEPTDRGAAILSTFPLTDITVIELPFEAHRRIALASSLSGTADDGEPWRLSVVNVHFDTSAGMLRGGPGPSRRRQARALIEAIERLPSPAIVAGDLNTWWGDDEPAVKELRRAFPDATPLRARETWRGPLGVGNKLDYLFARGFAAPVGVRRLPSRFGSDHWPLIAIVRPRSG